MRPAALLLAALALGCSLTGDPEERARTDQGVGRAAGEGWSLEVHEGLAHVLALEPARVRLRASAAELRLTLARTGPGPEVLRLELTNLPALPVSLEAPAGALLGPAEGEPLADVPLGRAWTLRLPPPGERLALATPTLPPDDFVFLAFGDIQTGLERFGDVVAAVNREAEAEFVLMLGDLTQRSREDEFDAVDGYFHALRMPVYATPGNHDVFAQERYQERYGRASYSFVHRGARFTSLDSASAGLDAAVWRLLQGWLDAGRGGLHVLFTHIPPIERLPLRGAQWNSRREARHFVALAGEGRVDRLLTGHVHTYDAYTLGGVAVHVSGGCGAIEERWDGIGRHYLRIHASPRQGTTRVEVVPLEPG